jgi:hypothetical protein
MLYKDRCVFSLKEHTVWSGRGAEEMEGSDETGR